MTVTGDVDADTLIKKLVKTGKRHAELWPESNKSDSSKDKKKKKKKKGKGKSNNKDKQQSDSESSEDTTSNHGGGDDHHRKDKQNVKVVEGQGAQDPAKNNEGGGTSTKSVNDHNVAKPNTEGGAVGGQPVKNGGGGGMHVKESKPEVGKTVTLPAGGQSPVAEKNTLVEIEGGAETSSGVGGGGGGKRKKKKGQNGNSSSGNEGEQQTNNNGGAPASTGSPTHHHHANGPQSQSFGPGQYPAPTNHISPRHHEYQYPQHYHAPPVYEVSYHAARPSSSYSASYYASPPPYSYSYASMHHGPGIEMTELAGVPYYVESYASQPSDSFELFSDENPNGCSIM